MAQIKIGLDYYAHNVGMTSDRRLRAIRREFGSSGIDVWFTLLDMIYSGRGYYLDFSEKSRSDVLWDITGEIRGRSSPDEAEVLRIIQALAQAELLDSDMFRRGILTSEAIQEQYYMGTLKRKLVAVDKEIWLLGVERMKQLNSRSPILENFGESGAASAANSENADGNSENADGIPQSKAEESISENNNEYFSTAEEQPLKSGFYSFAPYSTTPHTQPVDYEVPPELKENYETPDKIRIQLIEKYGEQQVRTYITRFKEWQKKKNAYKIEMYSQIRRWMEADCSCKPPREDNVYDSVSGTYMDDITLDCLEKYRSGYFDR